MPGNFGRNKDDGAPVVDLDSPDSSARIHNHDDIDSGLRAHHHTLGTGVTQAYPGNAGKVLEGRATAVEGRATSIEGLMHGLDSLELRYQEDMNQCFEDDFHDTTYSRWKSASGDGSTDGSWTVVKPSDAEFGSTVHQGQTNYRVMYSTVRIPYDPNQIYRVRVRARTISGAPVIYAGLRFYNDTANVPGTLPSGNWYGCTNGAQTPGAAWTEYVGYIAGISGGGTTNQSFTNPGRAPAGTMFFSPIMLAPYNPAPGDVLQVSMFKIETVDQLYADSGPIAPAYASGWADYGTTFQTVSYRKIGSRVYVQGMTKRTGAALGNQTVFTLPAGMRPSATLTFACDGDPGHARVDVQSTGAVICAPVLPTNGFLSFNFNFNI